MKTTPDEAALFREECLYWQREFGLTDWCLNFKVLPADGVDEAEASYDCETREAKLTYRIGVEDSSHPCDVALHEMLHLLFGDMLLCGVLASSEEDKLLAREEHRVIERIIKVLGKKKGKRS